jgi:beta-N-acetylhexosaminidase
MKAVAPMPSTNPGAGLSVGQTLLVGFRGTDARDVTPLVRRLRPAGLILLPRNVVSVDQVTALTGELQLVARDEGLPTLLFAVDQEGGSVARLASGAGFSDLPSAMAVGTAADAELARALAAATARELAAVGINLDLAPVVDLALDPRNTVIGSRSYGAEPSLVAAMAAAVVEGFRDEGVLACAKHFPGHGSTDVDSHVALPRLRATRDELDRRDLVPFRAAIAAGCAAVMTAHALSAIDPGTPATLSRATLTDLLRGAMGFRGLVLTDALEMQALRHPAVAPEEAGLAALRAGADLLVFEGDIELVDATVARLDRALDAGEVSTERLAVSQGRLAAARAAIGTPAGPPARAVVGAAGHAARGRRVAGRGLAVSDPAGLLPLRAVPSVVDSPIGRAFAASVGWPIAGDPGLVSLDRFLVGVADEDGLDPGVTQALAGSASEAAGRVLVVPGGWQVPPGVSRDVAVVLAYDLPKSLWALIADRLVGAIEPPSSARPNAGQTDG